MRVIKFKAAAVAFSNQSLRLGWKKRQSIEPFHKKGYYGDNITFHRVDLSCSRRQ